MKALFSALLVIPVFCNVAAHAQLSHPEHGCPAVMGHEVAAADVNKKHVDCGHNEWALMSGSTSSQAVNLPPIYGTLGIGAPGNTPGGRQAAATWVDASGDLWLFGGDGWDSTGNPATLSDLWKFSAGQWSWMGGPTIGGQSGIYGMLGVASPNNTPGARLCAFSWTDASGNFWLFGGNGWDSVRNEVGLLNDLWKYSGGQWTWMGGSELANPPGVYGTLGVASSSNVPGGRWLVSGWVDSAGDAWLFGGGGYDGMGAWGSLNDLWKYSGGQWTWMSGADVVNQDGVYGTQGVAAAGNVPGARASAYTWTDRLGNLWLFGGDGNTTGGDGGELNDLWKYSGGQWTWMDGSNVANQYGVYGTRGVASASNSPGTRVYGIAWSDSSGNGLIFGGVGYASDYGVGLLNDVWKYSGGEWTWIGGSDLANPSSTVVTQGTFAPGNVPGGRLSPSTWKDAKSNVWIFGGLGQLWPVSGLVNDLWWHKP